MNECEIIDVKELEAFFKALRYSMCLRGNFRVASVWMAKSMYMSDCCSNAKAMFIWNLTLFSSSLYFCEKD